MPSRGRAIGVLVFAAIAFGASMLLAPPSAEASKRIRYGIQDDAWLAFGPGSLEERLEVLGDLGVELVRFNLLWHKIAQEKPTRAKDPSDPAYDWGAADAVLKGLRDHGITPVVAILGAPRWANGDRPRNFAPRGPVPIRNFAYAAASRYPWVRHWLVWNEPNQRKWLRPTSPRTYVRKLLNPAYAGILAANPRAQIAGGVTAPRGGRGGVSPVDWIRGMARAGARLDAYAHHPYPLRPRLETPSSGGCGHCRTITMATLERLIREVKRGFGNARIWLTEYGYQTNPPDPLLGVSLKLQARYVADAALRARQAPRVEMLIHFLYRDEPNLGRWQSGLVDVEGAAKPAHDAFKVPLAQVSRSGKQTVLWGQLRPGEGRKPYRLQQLRRRKWRWVGGVELTSKRGFITRVVRAGPGATFRLWMPELGEVSRTVQVQ